MIRDGVFRKAGTSDTGGCVEVAALPGGGVQVRDTKDRSGGTQTYTDHEWACFLVGVRAGEFDLPD
jgi:Domain of unknown function (DUF397)